MSLVRRKAPLLQIGQMSAAFAASDVLRGAFRLASSLVIARGLGRDGFGRWTFYAAAAAALTAAFDLGFGVLLTRDAARDDGEIGSLVTAALTARLALFLPVGLCLYAVAGAPGVGLGAASAEATDLAVCLAAAGLAYGCLAAIHRASPRRLVAILAIETIGTGAQCAGAVLIVRRGGAVADLLRLATGVQVAQLVAAFVLWRLVAPRDRLARPSGASAWAHLRRAFPFALAGIVANARARMAPLLLGSLASAGEVASFGVAARLESTARRLPYATFGAALPVFAREAGGGEPDALRARFDPVLRWFAIAAAVGLIAGAAPIVRATYGAGFAAATWPLVWAAVGLVPSLVNHGRQVYLNATGHEHASLRWSAVAWTVQAVAGVTLIPRFGAVGAMCALLLGEVAIWLPLRAADEAAIRATSRRADRERGAPEPSGATVMTMTPAAATPATPRSSFRAGVAADLETTSRDV